MLEDIIRERKKKLARLRDAGIDPYPARMNQRGETIESVCADFVARETAAQNVCVAGRIRSVRDQGKIIFIDLEDGSGKLQAIIREEETKRFDVWRDTLDGGDIIAVCGMPTTTKRGEKSIAAHTVTMLAKALRSLPSDFYGLEDAETRLRQRYLDTILDKDVRNLFMQKAVFWNAFRGFLEEKKFMAVEMPIFEATPGGAEAEPFVTHHNALDQDFYLRISLEIALKKALVGGFEKVYEIGRIFRNEGIDAEHLQDYTQLEFYWAYADYRELMDMVKEMYQSVIKKTFGALQRPWKNQVIDWEKEWATVDYCSIFAEKNNGLHPVRASEEELQERARGLSIDIPFGAGRGRLIDLIFKKSVRPTLIQPCFLVDPPAAIEPLAKRKEGNPDVVERFQIVACGTELGKGFSEANDPEDQRQRFLEQMKLRATGDKEAQMLDEDFLEALEYGMPPTAGFGLSERLFAVLADKPVRETVFFPPMKRK
ncbi:MAG: lysine--tRNA ligase [Candidatus Paceibacterota bacterium]|jgi:lysyl-tRNA synthetase class 2